MGTQSVIYMRKHYLPQWTTGEKFSRSSEFRKRDYLVVNEIMLRFGTGAMVLGVLRLPEECVLFAREEFAWQRLPSASTG